MGSLSLWHWLIVLIVVLLIFGPRRLADIGKSMGDGVRSLKRALDGGGSAATQAARSAQASSTKTGT
jgi:sec-independent protein translocase protein TatA